MSAISRPLSVLFTLGVAACASGTAATGPASAPNTGATAPPAESAAPAPAAATPTADAGSTFYSDAQADGGRDTFRSLCTECHYSNEFSDAQFKFKWSRRSAWDLYELIFTQMPESAPGSLSPEETAGLTAYMLRMNGFEAGSTELGTDETALRAISLRSIRN